MKPPEHHFVNEYGQREIKRMWLGSGIADRNGIGIFEGDRVKFGEHDNTGVIEFSNSMFIIQHDDSYRFTVLGNTAGFVDVEIVGHISEEQS